MTRTLLAAAVAVAVAAAATAAPVPKTPPAPAPKAGASVQLASAKLNGEVIQITLTYDQTVSVPVTETVEQNGQQVTVTKLVQQTKQVSYMNQMPLKGTKATTADGKEVSEEDLAKKLADTTAVVQVPTGFDPEWKKLFADDVIFLEPAKNVGVIGRPGGGIVRPVPLPVNPGGVAPAPVPPAPIEK